MTITKRGAGEESLPVELLKDLAYYIVGALLYALSVDVFSAPNDIVPGGVTGIATVLHSLYKLPIGTTMLAMNIPLFIAALIFIGWRYVLRTGICLGIVSAAIDLLDPILPEYKGDMVLATVFGGVLMGLSLAVVFMRGSSTGGTDIVARIFGKFWPQVTQGRLILLVDCTIITAASYVFGREAGSFNVGLEAALYAVISLFVSSFALDKVLYGTNTGRQLFIITRHADAINKGILERLDRGTTILTGRGGYSGKEREIIMCAVRNSEVYRVRSIVRAIDHEAFIIIGNASEIVGEGFKSIAENEFGEKEEIKSIAAQAPEASKDAQGE